MPSLSLQQVIAAEKMDIEGQTAEQPAPPSSMELFCICIHCPYDMLDELARRVKMEVIVEVGELRDSTGGSGACNSWNSGPRSEKL